MGSYFPKQNLTGLSSPLFPLTFYAIFIFAFIPIENFLGLDLRLPSIFSFLVAVCVFAFCVFEKRVRLPKLLFIYFMSIIFIYSLWGATRIFIGEDFAIDFLVTNLNFIYSLVIALASFIALSNSNTRHVWLYGVRVLILVLSGLLTDYFFSNVIFQGLRNILYGDAVYSAIGRDILLWGSVRPLFLFQEPSYVAVFLSVLFVLLLKSCRGRKSLVFLFIAWTVSVALVRSPILAVPFGYVIFDAMDNRGRHLPIMITLIALAFVFYFLITGEYFIRYSEMGMSTGARLLFPLMILYYNITDTLFIGPGLGDLPVSYFSNLPNIFTYGSEAKYLTTNAALEYIIANGIFLSFIFLYGLWKCFYFSYGTSLLMFSFCYFSYGSIVGGAFGHIFWLIFLVVLYAHSQSYRFVENIK